MNAQTPKHELEAAFYNEAEERAMRGELIHMTLTILDSLAVFAALQLALRHPGFCESIPAEQAKSVAYGMQKMLSTTPAMAEAMRRGWLPEYDLYVPPNSRGDQ